MNYTQTQRDNKKKYSLAKRLSLSIAIIVVIATTIFGFLQYVTIHSRMEKEIEDRAEEMIQFLKGTLVVPIWDFNYNAVSAIGDTLFQNEIVAGLHITDPRGNVLYANDRKLKDAKFITKKPQYPFMSKDFAKFS